MDFFTLHNYVLILVAATCVQRDSPQFDMNQAPELFQDFVDSYRKEYLNALDVVTHFEAFKHNMEKVNQMKNRKQKYRINQYFDNWNLFE